MKKFEQIRLLSAALAHADEICDEAQLETLAKTASTRLLAQLLDVERFHWLCADLQGIERQRRNEILERMAVMSYSAICEAIDNIRYELAIDAVKAAATRIAFGK